MTSKSPLLSLCLLIGFQLPGAVQPTFYARQDYPGLSCALPGGGYLMIADTNGDGIPDILCQPNVLFGNGDGTFRLGPSIGYVMNETEIGDSVAADVNGDGRVDIIFASYPKDLLGISVMLGNGDGTFQSPVFYPSTVSYRAVDATVVVGDFNGDGKLDVAETEPDQTSTTEILLFAGHGDGSFSMPTSITVQHAFQKNVSAIAAVDMNGDGFLDLVIDATSDIDVFLGNGDGTFQPQMTTPTAHDAGFGAFAVGDVTGDGIPDAVISNLLTGAVLLYPGKGDGTFRSPSSIDLPGGFVSLVVADLNGDGIPDLVNDNGEVAFGKGYGKFEPPVYYPLNEEGLGAGGGLGVADLRSDGRMDILGGQAGVSVLLNTGKGIFKDGVPTVVAGGFIGCSAAGDFNGDGISDLVVSSSAAIEIYLGSGKAGVPFVAGATYPVTNAGCPVVGDLNGDGILDLLVSSGNENASGVVIGFLGNGDGTFQQGPSSAVSSIGLFVLGDFNGDGKLDYATDTNLLAFGNGDGGFGTPASYVTNIGPNGLFGIASADLNGDGNPDIVLTDPTDGTLYVLLATGTGGFQETSTNVPNCYEPSYLALGDINGDGKPDIALSCTLGVGVYLNNGGGAFGSYFLLGDQEAVGGNVVIADLNGDGVSDVALQNVGDISVFLGQGSNTFAAQFYLGTGNNPVSLFALDTHGQKLRRGTPDLLEVDESGVIYDLINETR